MVKQKLQSQIYQIPFNILVEIGESKICARDVNNKIDACQGDSGGPMMIQKPDSNGKCE